MRRPTTALDRGDHRGRPDGLDRLGPAIAPPGLVAGSVGGRLSGLVGDRFNETPSIYGATSTRGARYLMRNGLDYLNYQQFERALKFLRCRGTSEGADRPRATHAEAGHQAPRMACEPRPMWDPPTR